MTLNLGRVWPLCACGHTAHGHSNQHGVCERCNSCDKYVAAPDWPILPRKAPVIGESMLADIRSIVAARAQECYGNWHDGTPEEIDELARAIVQRFIMGEK